MTSASARVASRPFSTPWAGDNRGEEETMLRGWGKLILRRLPATLPEPPRMTE